MGLSKYIAEFSRFENISTKIYLHLPVVSLCYFVGMDVEEEIIWNFDNVQKAYATRGYEAIYVGMDVDIQTRYFVMATKWLNTI
jgi:hypothetical protein